MPQRVHEEIGILPAIEAELHLSEICRQMLCADSMPCADDTALQERERILDSVGVNVAIDVNFALVLDRFMTGGEVQFFHRGGVGIKFIGNDDVHVGAHVLPNVLCQSAALGIFCMEKSCIAAALTNADNDLLGAKRMTGLVLMALMLPADVGFVHFDGAIQHGALYFFHRGTNAVTEIPCRFVAHAESAFDLIRAHALSCFDQEQHGHKPRFQRKVRIVEDGLRQYAKLVATLDAFKFLLCRNFKHALALAAQTLHSERPAQLLQQSAALFVRGEHLSEIGESHG